MTMTASEEKTLRQYAEKAHAVGTLHYIVAVLARVALKEAAIKAAQAQPPSEV